MILEVEVNGRTRIVSVEPVAPGSARFRVTIDGRTREVDVRSVDAWTLSLIVLDAGGTSHEVGLVDSGVPGELILQTREGPLRAVVKGRKGQRGRCADSAGPSGEQRVVAPMPGKVVRVLVAQGAAVQPRQGLVVIEAMKMENELTSPTAGSVKVVAVEEGMAVKAGQLLVVIEPAVIE